AAARPHRQAGEGRVAPMAGGGENRAMSTFRSSRMPYSRTLCDLLFEQAGRHGDHPALICHAAAPVHAPAGPSAEPARRSAGRPGELAADVTATARRSAISADGV